jgi:hypothetical protein
MVKHLWSLIVSLLWPLAEYVIHFLIQLMWS